MTDGEGGDGTSDTTKQRGSASHRLSPEISVPRPSPIELRAFPSSLPSASYSDVSSHRIGGTICATSASSYAAYFSPLVFTSPLRSEQG